MLVVQSTGSIQTSSTFTSFLGEAVNLFNNGDATSAENRIMEYLETPNAELKPDIWHVLSFFKEKQQQHQACLLYTSDAADELDGVDLGGRRIIKKKK